MDESKRYKPYGSNIQIRNPSTTRFVGWRYAALISCFVGAIGGTFYLVGISPMLNPEPWQDIQKTVRAGIKQEDIQPGNMKVWSDPFERSKSERKWY